MKNIKPLLLSAFLLLTMSCGKDFGDLNVDPNNPQLVPPEALLTASEKALADNLGFYGLTPADVLAQTWAQNNYTGFSRYGIDPGFLNVWFAQMYAGALEDLADLQKVVAEHPSLDAAADQNKIAIAKILQAYSFQIVTDVFGPVPYTDALQGSRNRTPKYDSQKDIYLGLINNLHEAISMLDESAGSFETGDILYGGDVAKWKKFAHALLLRVALRMSDVPEVAGLAQTEVEAAAAAAFTGNEDSANFHFLGSPPNNLPLNQQRIERGDADLGLSNILIDSTLKPLNDPRLPKFADTNESGDYAGRPYGQTDQHAAGDPIGNYSQPSGAAVVRAGATNFQPTDVLRPDAVACFMGYAEVCFILAEAKERGWNVSGTAAGWYDAGITASMNEWGITDGGVISAYLLQTGVQYDSVPGGWRQKIGVQKWLALFMQGVQGWTEWRRLDFDKLRYPVDDPLGDFPDNLKAPLRIPYPSNEQGVNGANYTAAIGLLGGPDKLSTRVWWDIQ